MRWIFLLLLIINGAFYYWHNYYAVSPADIPVELGVQGEPIVLLSEVEPPDVEASASSGSEVACWIRGPYKKYDVAQQFAGGATSYSVKAEPVSSGVEFWVYLGPFGSHGDASAKHLQLRKKKVDSFVIRSGPLRNAVSLGLFSDSGRASVQAERMRERGYKAQIRRLEQAELRYWVLLRGPPEQASVEEARRQLFNKRNDGASAEKKSCNLVASWE